MNQNELRKLASSILSEGVLTGLKEWYTKTLDERWDYVVFIVRRSYILALIMELITGKKMQSDKIVHYLTDASIMLHCEELADVYRRNRRFPTILLCDDVCIHGRNINHMIALIEKRLIFLLPEYDEADIREALLDALQIHVYVRFAGPLLLLGRYEFNLSFVCKESVKFIYGFSSDISMLILRSGIANASYIYSQKVPCEVIESVKQNGYIETSYQNNKQYTWVKFIGEGYEKKAIFTLRILETIDNQYMILPFVFMPNLGEEETSGILRMIQARMRDRNIREKYIVRLNDLEQIPGKRTFNEIITLLFSCVLLQDFNREYDINIQDSDKKAEIIKLARNYDWYGFEDAKDWIDSIVSMQLFTVEEVEKIIDACVLPSRKMIRINPGIEASLSKIEKQMIRDKVEQYFYRKGCEEEKEAYELSRRSYVSARERVSRTVRGCGFLFWDINKEYTELKAKYSMAYFLQMTDTGACCLSSFAPNYMNVIGISQFAKTGEQALMSEPLKLYEWIPVLSMIEEDSGGKLQEFNSILRKYGESRFCDFNGQKYKDIEKFIENIYRIGHKIQDWNMGNTSCLYKVEIDLPDTEELSQHKKRSKFLDLQIEHIMNYNNYKRNY